MSPMSKNVLALVFAPVLSGAIAYGITTWAAAWPMGKPILKCSCMVHR